MFLQGLEFEIFILLLEIVIDQFNSLPILTLTSIPKKKKKINILAYKCYRQNKGFNDYFPNYYEYYHTYFF